MRRWRRLRACSSSSSTGWCQLAGRWWRVEGLGLEVVLEVVVPLEVVQLRGVRVAVKLLLHPRRPRTRPRPPPRQSVLRRRWHPPPPPPQQ